MSTRKEHGFLRRNGLQIQPDRKIIGKNDGTLEGSIEWVVDRDNEHLLPQIYSAHPDDPRLLVYHQEIVRNMAGKSTLTCQYMGISSDPTPRIIQFPSASGQDPIETHENFGEFAGDKDNPMNGARFDPATGEFLGFFDSSNDKFGVRSYIVPNVMVYLSYWTFRRPAVRNLMSIESSLSGVIKPPNVKNWLLVGMPYREIGKLYQVTEQYMGSGSKGWDRDIYT